MGWNLLTTLPPQLFLTRSSGFATQKVEDWANAYEKGALWAFLLTGLANRENPVVQTAIAQSRELACVQQLAALAPQTNSEMQSAATLVLTRDWIRYLTGKRR